MGNFSHNKGPTYLVIFEQMKGLKNDNEVIEFE